MPKAIRINSRNRLALSKEYGFYGVFPDNTLYGLWLVTPFPMWYPGFGTPPKDEKSFVIMGTIYLFEHYRIVSKFLPDGSLDVEPRY